MVLTEADTFRELVEERDRLAVALKAVTAERDALREAVSPGRIAGHDYYMAVAKKMREGELRIIPLEPHAHAEAAILELRRDKVALEADNQRLRAALSDAGNALALLSNPFNPGLSDNFAADECEKARAALAQKPEER